MFQGQKFVADLQPDGRIRWPEANQVFNSPSAWAIYCKRLVNPSKKSGCGWASVCFWYPLYYFIYQIIGIVSLKSKLSPSCKMRVSSCEMRLISRDETVIKWRDSVITRQDMPCETRLSCEEIRLSLQDDILVSRETRREVVTYFIVVQYLMRKWDWLTLLAVFNSLFWNWQGKPWSCLTGGSDLHGLIYSLSYVCHVNNYENPCSMKIVWILLHVPSRC